MNIGTIGVGRMGSNLGKLWAEKGHRVCFGGRDLKKAKSVADYVGLNSIGGSIAEAAAVSDILLLATPWEVVPEALQAAGSLDRKILIDCTNPFASSGEGLAVGYDTSGAEQVAEWATGARVVKAFNGVHWQNLDEPNFSGMRASVFYCGDDADAKAAVGQLISDIGFEPVDSGPLSNARYIEPMVYLWIQLAFRYGYGADMAFKVLKR
jgi:8-hydroxy-5-deazaflavin:NADPH oxidoreductase